MAITNEKITLCKALVLLKMGNSYYFMKTKKDNIIQYTSLLMYFKINNYYE